MTDCGRGCVALAIMVLVMAVCLMSLCGCVSRVEPTDVVTDHVNGMPLDACTVTEYDRPVWLPYCDHAFKVYDRQTGSAWWLLVINEGTECEGYVVLPLAEADR